MFGRVFRALSAPLLPVLGVFLFSEAFGETVNEPPKIRVLIVDGFNNHDWEAGTKLIRDILLEDEEVSVDVSTVPAYQSDNWKEWLPEFSDYSVVVQNTNNLLVKQAWPEPARLAFEKYLAEGGGMLVFHSANNSFSEWPEYNRMIGLGWRKQDFGKAIEVVDGKAVEIPAGVGANTSHGRRVDAVVKRVGDHPIHNGLPEEWMAADLEVYRYARGPAENLQVLSYAREDATKKDFPIEWVVNYGKGRVYNSTYGHYMKKQIEMPPGARCVAFRTLMKRAVRWLAGEEVSEDVPEDFPTAEATSVIEN